MMDNEINNKTQRQMLMDLTVSAAVQGSKLDTVITTLKEHCENEAEWRETHNTTSRGVGDGRRRDPTYHHDSD
jgi:hypothetical protein